MTPSVAPPVLFFVDMTPPVTPLEKTPVAFPENPSVFPLVTPSGVTPPMSFCVSWLFYVGKKKESPLKKLVGVTPPKWTF